MPRTAAPSMPTERQIQEVHKAVASLRPDARIKCVGPEGVIFEYPEASNPATPYQGKPFSAG